MHLYCSFVLSVYKDFGYAEMVDDLAEESMQVAVDEVKTLPHYSEEGEVYRIAGNFRGAIFSCFSANE